MRGYPSDRLHEEIAFLSYYFHWDYDTLMNMEHAERRRWCGEVSQIHRRLSETNDGAGGRSIEEVF